MIEQLYDSTITNWNNEFQWDNKDMQIKLLRYASKESFKVQAL